MSFPAEPQQPLPPLAGLVTLLRASGFMVTTDDYVHLLKIVEEWGSEPPHSLALRICPIIAITAEEQERFYHVFGAYMQQQGALGSGIAPRWRRWLRRLLVPLAVTVAIVVNIIALQPDFVEFTDAFDTEKVLMPGESYEDEVVHLGIALGKEKDTVPVQAQWLDSGRGVIGNGVRIRHPFTDTGLHIIRREVTAGPRSILHKTARQQVYVCAAAVSISIDGPERVAISKAFRLSAVQKTGGKLIKGYVWDTSEIANAGRVLRMDSASVTLHIDSPGIYTLRCTPLAPAASARCVSGSSIDIDVADTGKQYEVSFSQSSNPFVPGRTLRKGPWYLLLPLLGAIGYWGFARRRKPTPPQETLQAEGPKPNQNASSAPLRPPYEVPFPPSAAADVVVDKSLRRFLQLLRFQAEEEEQEPDIRASIRATIRSAGMAEVVFRPRRRIQEYMLFIDGSRPQGMMYALYGYIAQLMEAEGIPASVFYCDADFNCAASAGSAGVPLRSIADNNPDALPVILGNGNALMHPFGGVIHPDLLEQWRRWDTVLFITPKPRAEWGGQERTLAKHLLTAPAEAAALARLGQDFKAGRRAKFEAGVQEAGDEPQDFKSVAGLRTYLGGDEALFQWLCALCIYPKPRWELVVAFGKAVLTRYDRLQDLSYDHLLRLCRIPWMAEGTFPQRLRMGLLKTLTVENEVAARAALVSLLQGVRTRYAGDFLFSAELQLQATLSRFVLYGHDPQRFSAHAAAVNDFKRLLGSGEVTDVPARKYLEGSGTEDWTTPLKQAPEALVEDELQRRRAAIAVEQSALRKAHWARRIAAAVAILALMGGWLFLSFNEAVRKAPLLSSLYVADSSQPVLVSYAVRRDFTACGDYADSFNVLPATLYAGGKAYAMPFERRTQTLSCMIPLKGFSNSPTSITLGIGGASEPVIYRFEDAAQRRQVLIRCSQLSTVTDTARNELTASLPAYLNEIWTGKTNNRLLNLNLVKGMIYYSTGGPTTWGTSRIYNVTRTLDSGFRIVANVFPGYMVFFLKRVRPEGFRMAFCQQRWDKPDEALKAPEDCSAYDDMRLYYPDYPKMVYLPVMPYRSSNATLVASQSAKLPALISGVKPSPVIRYGLKVTQSTNRTFLTTRDITVKDIWRYIGANTIYKDIAVEQTSISDYPNPFIRESIILAPDMKYVPSDSALQGMKQNNQRTQVVPSSGKNEKEELAQAISLLADPKTEQDAEMKLLLLAQSKDRLIVQESRYKLAEHYVSVKDYAKAKPLLLVNTSSSAPLSNWRISSLLLLADVYEATDEKDYAIKVLYTAQKYSLDPDVERQVKQRLDRLRGPSAK